MSEENATGPGAEPGQGQGQRSEPGSLRFAGVPHVVPRPLADLAPLLDWLRAGRPAGEEDSCADSCAEDSTDPARP
ncbi:hypothetical protein AB0L81_45900, partial [Streptomyces sp. NPDC052127]